MSSSASTWNLSQAESLRAQRRLQDEEDEALRLAKRGSRWRGVRVESGFTERSRRRRPGAVKTQELYLRDDLHCGVDACPRCEAQPHVRIFRPPRRLQRDHAEYVVPDAFALLQLMELLEDEHFGREAKHVLLLESVLQEALRIAPSRDATRLKTFFKDESRRMVEPCCVVLFPNQHHVETYVEQAVVPAVADGAVALESQASRDRRAIVKTLTWYATQQHVAGSSRVVFMTPDVDSPLCAELRERLQLEVTTCEDFVKTRFKNPAFLLELAVNTAEAVRWWQDQQLEAENGVVQSKGEFPPHLPPAQLKHRVQTGELVQGRLDVSAHNPMEAFVVVDKSVSGRAGVERIFVWGREAMNRGIHGDDVVVELLPRAEWRAPQSERELVHYSADETTTSIATSATKESSHDSSAATAIPTAVVVGVARRSSQFVVATVLAPTVAPGDDVALAIPMDVRIPKIRIRSQRMDALLDKRLKLVVDHWPMDSMYPSGHYTAVLGEHGSLPAELSAILVRHEIEEAPFCEAALACLPAQCEIDTYAIHECSTAKRPEAVPLLDWRVPADEAARRRDLRGSHRVFSVDPPGCQDIDDAMSVRRLPNGNLELGVHIADVSFFVAHDSPLDLEGRARATTVYLVGQRLDMLPAVLSADLCSLHARVDRLAVSVLWELDATTLEVVEDKTWFGRTVINSCASMTYGQAHRILHGLNADTGLSATPPSPPRRGVAGGPVPVGLQRELARDLRQLTLISRRLATARGEDGGLDLSRSETFSLNVSELGEGGGVEIVMKESLEIHGTIAELMILANAHVARQIVRAFPARALLRRHPPPRGPRFQQLTRIAEAKQIAVDATNNYTLQQSLVHAERSGRADAKTMALLKSLAVRVMSEAEYVCASAAEASREQAANGDATRFAHYGLGLQFYTHFTSPIRRYADIVVHRQLLAALARDATGATRRLVLPGGKRHTRGGRERGLALPASLVASVLEKTDEDEEDKDDEDGDAFLDALVADVDSKLQVEDDDDEDDELIFPPRVLVPLTQHLNRKNRHAKQAARSCEELFLALYFSTHTVRTVAIVTALRQNGFLVYVPTYDLRAPVYVRDRDGRVQIDPLLCGVRIVDTLPPTGAFATADCIRLLPHATLELDAANERLTVTTPNGGSGTSFAILDEIEVQIACDLSGSNARVPQLQLQLVGRVTKASRERTSVTTTKPATTTTTTTSAAAAAAAAAARESSIPELQRFVQTTSAAPPTKTTSAAAATTPMRTTPPPSMYDVLLAKNHAIASLSPQPKKPKALLLTRPAAATQASAAAVVKSSGHHAASAGRRRGPGRLVFGDYEPPATQHYQQKLASYMDQRSEALEDALSIPRGGAAGGALGSADEIKQLEGEAMARATRLASEKRHDRINARRKAGH